MSTTTELTFDEVLDSLTGYDELAIKSTTDVPLSKMLAADSVHALRAVIGIHTLRETGKSGSKAYQAAYKAAMEMPLSQVRQYFAEPPGDPIPDEPDSTAGKDDSPSDRTTTT
ncbi:hypothetical protein [Kribbella sp. CA-293567]|uniref:hypothetical protein n=1 Tax=Kribbella sp. CA-293567 TaxID=3002436 RepID=UPI0022DD8A41|nr:hypothetical protein [Kribbella sp. CA-293567]WBQ02941.1 hypothetical protein OX958_23510 [Kribbella sp. CA-293567]